MGKIISVQELDTVTFGEDNKKIGEVNPFRYRGYYYDAETGFYYLNSRYYDPQVKRFINADAYASTGQGFNGTNMFCYCWNNPVNKVDKTGHMAAEAATAATNWWNPLGWIAAGILLVEVVATVYVCNTIANSSSREYYGPSNPYIGSSSGSGSSYAANAPSGYASASSIPYAASLQNSKAKDKGKDRTTFIYRYGGTNPGNLTPKEKDKYTGLSFSTVPKPGAAVTTVEALNATGLVYVVRDGATHVSVRPVGGTMDDWINAGSSSVWTQAVKSVVIKWDGVK